MMNTTGSSPTRAQKPLGVVSFIAGLLAIALSVGGQLLAAHRLATDWNSGHPSADQSIIHSVLVAPSFLIAIIAIWFGVSSCRKNRRYRRLAILGIILSAIAVGLTLLDVPGDIAADYWIEPRPDDH